MKIALLGNITLDFFAQDFRRMGHEVYVPPGFDTWRQETLDPESGLHRFAPDATLLLLPNEDVFKVVTDLSSLEDPTSLASLAPSLTLSSLAHETPGFWDDRMRRLAAMPFSLAGLKAIEEEFLFLAEFAAAPKKILAVDADNTLWRGIVSEDDPATVVPYADFQRGLLALKDAGALLVLLSKNDSPANSDAPVARAFARSDMPLSLDDFAAVAVNWSTKASNMLDVCSRLNLSPDSAVFIDDNPHERAQMKAHLPAVTVMPFPQDMTRPAAILRRLRTRFFASVASTDEDRVRTALYQAEAARRASAASLPSLTAYLDSLGMTCAASLATPSDIPRLAQMAGKTNQFNATTIRRTADEIAAIVADPKRRTWTFRLSDNFGEMGLVCYIIYDCATRRITDFVMSCRAMGRTLEHFALNHVRHALAEEGIPLDGIDFAPTAKNAPFREFLDSIDLSADLPTHVVHLAKAGGLCGGGPI